MSKKEIIDLNSPIREIGGSSYKLWRAKRLAKRADRFRNFSRFIYNIFRRINYTIHSFWLWISSRIENRSERLHRAGTKVVLSNPSCKYINHCTLMLNFTVDNTDKYQIIHEGRFTDRYKEFKKKEKAALDAGEEFDEMPLGNKEMFLLINAKYNQKFKMNEL